MLFFLILSKYPFSEIASLDFVKSRTGNDSFMPYSSLRPVSFGLMKGEIFVDNNTVTMLSLAGSW
jgi:hypothetical protein